MIDHSTPGLDTEQKGDFAINKVFYLAIKLYLLRIPEYNDVSNIERAVRTKQSKLFKC